MENALSNNNIVVVIDNNINISIKNGNKNKKITKIKRRETLPKLARLYHRYCNNNTL